MSNTSKATSRWKPAKEPNTALICHVDNCDSKARFFLVRADSSKLVKVCAYCHDELMDATAPTDEGGSKCT